MLQSFQEIIDSDLEEIESFQFYFIINTYRILLTDLNLFQFNKMLLFNSVKNV